MKIAVIGLGYVGLPLAHAFAAKGLDVIGYDINEERIAELQNNKDRTGELTEKQLQSVSMTFSADASVLEKANIKILAIPTPVDAKNKPDLSLLEKASESIGEYLNAGDIVVYESTVYPGTTEEICGPLLEKASGLKCGEDFFLGYSPERINPGDKVHTVETIIKIVAGQNEETLQTLSDLYGKIITAGVYQAPSIKVAEMAKAIENAQRDLNIAFVNEVALLCDKIGITTSDVLEAAGTKWNFLPFKPGIVGGHCIGVDPYYLVEKAKQLGMETHVITAGRTINDGMSAVVARQIAEHTNGAKRVLVLGLTFKEDVPDTRNSKSFEVVTELQKAGCTVEAHDPYVTDEELRKHGITKGSLEHGSYNTVALLVPHKEYRSEGINLCNVLEKDGLLYDLKSFFTKKEIEEKGMRYKAL